jgi:hypothetical protein
VDWDSLLKLLALSATALVALGTSWLVTRHERPRPPALVEGYPPRDFSRRDLVEAEALASLCQSQSGLLSLYRKLPASSPGRAGLLVFLEELRAVMDGAYQLAHLQASAEARARLSRLARDVATAAHEMTERTRRHLDESSNELIDSELEVRLDVMRALARDLEDSERR